MEAASSPGPGAWLRVAALAGALALGAGCSEGRPARQGQAPCPTFVEVQPALHTHCASCHGATLAEGGYRVDSYEGTIAREADGTPRAQAGQAGTPLLLAARGELAGHSAMPEPQRAQLEDWVLRCELPRGSYAFHLNGWMDPANGDFHGNTLRAASYELSQCRDCHGEDLRGGKAQVDCQSCHAQGVQTCNTCHGDATSAAPPRDVSGLTATSLLSVGAHRTHVTDGPRHRAFGCEVCHVTPTALDAEGHYRKDGKPDESPAEVVLGTDAARWQRDQATCVDSTCHAPSKDANATNQSPRWTAVGQGQADCGSCHGLPPQSHADDRCEVCHRPAYANGALRPETHVNGRVDLTVADAQSCTGCHGDETSPAPPSDLYGRTAESLRGVGAHRAHLESRHKLSAPIACTECHQVPASLQAAGHIDSAAPAELFPQVSGVGTLARSGGAATGYDPATGTCTTYCHGAGTLLAADTTPGLQQRPTWTGGTPEAACGTCHGLPPKLPGSMAHNGITQITQCVGCHAETVTAGGAIRIQVDPGTGQLSSTHINGRLEKSP